MIKLVFILAAILVGCSKGQIKKDEFETQERKDDLRYEKAVILYKQDDYEGAKKELSKLIGRGISSEKYREALYLRGKVFKQNEEPSECIEDFRQVIELSKLVKDSFFFYSLYFSGICYELKNEPAKAVAVYQDALRTPSLPDDLRNLEIPARLAIVYSRMGEAASSKVYYEKTRRELEKFKKNRISDPEQKALVADIIINMGTLTPDFSPQEDFEDYLSSIKISQEYLALIFKLNEEYQSSRALDKTLEHFENAFKFIQSLSASKSEEPVLSQIEKQLAQKKLALALLSNLDAFEAYLTPEMKSNNKSIQEQMSRLYSLKKELEDVVSEKDVRQNVTEEAKKLMEPKVPIKIRDEKTGLEKRSNRDEGRLPIKKEVLGE